MIVVHYECGDSNTWDTDVDQPARFTDRRDARRSAFAHLAKGTSNSQTRVRMRDTRTGEDRTLTDYGYADSGWIRD